MTETKKTADKKTSEKKVETKKVSHMQIHIGRDGVSVIHIEFEICGYCRASDFGKTVFTDRADALHALDEYLNREKTWLKKN